MKSSEGTAASIPSLEAEIERLAFETGHEKLIRQVVRIALESAAAVCEARYMGDNNREDMEAKACATAILKLLD